MSLPVQVRNVPPQIASASVKDSLGHDLDGGATPTIVGLPVTVAATFTDPGVADTQSASIDWGDGSPLDTSFTSFSDAHGGAIGAAQGQPRVLDARHARHHRHAHRRRRRRDDAARSP